jgi:hypothetical protein
MEGKEYRRTPLCYDDGQHAAIGSILSSYGYSTVTESHLRKIFTEL